MSNTKATKRPRMPVQKSTATAVQEATDTAAELSEEIQAATHETEKLQRAILEDQQRRERQCSAAISEALETYRCRLQPRTIIVGQQVTSEVIVTAEITLTTH